jgi:hypothetical protein
MSLNYFFSTGVRGLSEGKQENQIFFFYFFLSENQTQPTYDKGRGK